MTKETSEIRKKQIILATLDILAEKGITGLTTAELAKRVGFSEAALFRHFPSKLEILKAVMEYSHRNILQKVEFIYKSELGSLTKLEEILKFKLKFIEENKGMPRIIFSDELHMGNEELRETLIKFQKKYMKILISIFKEGVFSGVFRKDLDIKMATRAFLGLIQVIVFESSVKGFDISVKEQFEPISSFLRGCFIARTYCL